MNLSKELKKKRDAEDRLRQSSPTKIYIEGTGYIDLSQFANKNHTHKIIDLSDTPNDYVADKFVKVNSEGTGFEYGDGSSGSEYTLPQATETELGGIKASPKTSAETQEVKIDNATGKLYSTPPTSAQNGIPAGGTAGQILSKIDGTDYNTQWIDAPSGGGNVSINFDSTTTTEGQNKSRTSSGGFLYLEVEVIIRRFIKLTKVLWDIYGIDTYTLSINGDDTVANSVTTVANNTAEVEFSLINTILLEPGSHKLRITGTTSQKMNDAGSSNAYSGSFVEFTKNSNYGGSIFDYYPAIKLVAYKGLWTIDGI